MGPEGPKVAGSDKATTSYILSFDQNTAGAAGGAIYTTCFSLGVCQEVMKMTLGIPMTSGSRPEVISLVDNRAHGYGNDVATAPAKIAIVGLLQQYVPGMTPLNITFSLQDAQGLPVVGSAHRPIFHQVRMLALSVDNACSTFAACQRLKLQPTESYYSDGVQEITSIVSLRQIPLKYCQAGVGDVQLRFFLSTGDNLDVTGASESELMTLQTSTVVTCLPCVAGWERIEVVTEEFPAGLWTCRLGSYMTDFRLSAARHDLQAIVYHADG